MTRSPAIWRGVWLGLLLPAISVAQQPTVRNPHGTLAQPCAVCHSPQAWSPARISSSFDHAKAAHFPLEGAHAAVACKSCHTSLTFKEAPRDCVGCHKDPHRGELGTTCGRCHTMRSFVDRAEMGRAHQLTRFPLTGAHVAVDCEACHTVSAQGQMTFVARATDCNSCHLKDYQATRNPDHNAGGFPHDCQACHVTVSWMGAKFDHSATRFPLTGAHVAVNCIQCHGTGGFGALPTACVSCHQTDYNNAKDPNHQQAQFPTECTVCHSTTTWTSATFNHNTTNFPLTGAHVQVTCAQCHGDGVYKGKPTACVSCHQTDYNNTKDPNHQQAQLPSDCTVCHTTTTWNGANFNHGTTNFPLTGAHVQATCAQCHGDGVYKGKPTACVSCHQTDYNNTKDPNHQQAQFPSDCTVCHTTTTWNGANFNHSTTNFPLTGAHVQATCAQCHGDGVYKGKPTACVSCHQTDYNNAKDPNHQQAQFPSDCTVCHTTTTWNGANFNHSTTSFPLTGAHVQLTCDQCHGDGVYKGKPKACVSCHQADYTRTTTPNHQQAQFPTDCTVCHTTTTWNGASFNHNTTSFPLTGAHIQLTCDQCHGDGVYRGKPTTCVSCHQTDFNNTRNPSHQQAQFPTDCTVCHTTSTWNGASFNHSNTAFPLTGAHAQATCAQCHGDGVYKGKPTTCVSCHQTDYNNTTDPNHQQSQFSTDCASCHTSTVWTSASFTNHDAQYFPIYSGAHRGRWTNCSTCHVNPSDYRQFDCLSCHSASQTTPHHSGVNGYSYDSPSCYRCHPRGRGG